MYANKLLEKNTHGRCIRCLPGTGPNDDRTECVRCPEDFSSPNGQKCEQCPPNYYATENRERCIEKPFLPVPNCLTQLNGTCTVCNGQKPSISNVLTKCRTSSTTVEQFNELCPGTKFCPNCTKVPNTILDLDYKKYDIRPSCLGLCFCCLASLLTTTTTLFFAFGPTNNNSCVCIKGAIIDESDPISSVPPYSGKCTICKTINKNRIPSVVSDNLSDLATWLISRCLKLTHPPPFRVLTPSSFVSSLLCRPFRLTSIVNAMPQKAMQRPNLTLSPTRKSIKTGSPPAQFASNARTSQISRQGLMPLVVSASQALPTSVLP